MSGYKAQRKTTRNQVLAILTRENTEGSIGPRRNRRSTLLACCDILRTYGYGKQWNIRQFGIREMNRILDSLRRKKLAPGTVENYMTHIRWLTRKIGAVGQIPARNKDVSIAREKNWPSKRKNKAKALDPKCLEGVVEWAVLVTELREAFGLRLAEACRFDHAYATAFLKADAGPIRLHGSWCKNGRPREIPVTNDIQRRLLAKVKAFQDRERRVQANGQKSMIPDDKCLDAGLSAYSGIQRRYGIPGHGLRHHWAQERFRTVAGFPCPFAGGPKYSELSPKDQEKWDKAAGLVNRELGHGAKRDDITAIYIGERQ